MHFTKNLKIEAYEVAIDFEEIFDSINWDYLWEAFETYNIQKSFINMMKLLYNDTKSCVKNNDTSTSYFKIKRGVRQGDPIAAYLFTLAIKLLAIEIRENKSIEGIQVNKTKIELSMYAVDMTVAIKLLAIEIRENKSIEGIQVNKTKIELSMYAVDMTGLVVGIASINDKLQKCFIWNINASYEAFFSFNVQMDTLKLDSLKYT